MTGVDEFEMAFLVEDPEKHRGVASEFHVLAKELIDVVHDDRRFDADPHGR